MRRARLVALVALLIPALSGCGGEKPGAHSLFIPAVIRAGGRRHTTWRTVVTARGEAGQQIRIGRWPPNHPAAELETLTLGPTGTVPIPSLVLDLPAVSSLTLDSDRPFDVAAAIEGKRGGVSLAPLGVPVLDARSLARPGDQLRVGPLVSNDRETSHFCVTLPWTERDTAPFRLEFVFTAPDGREILREERATNGVPWLVANPWSEFWLPKAPEVYLEVNFLNALRGRKPVLGVWLYAVTQEKATGASRFLTTTVRRGARN